MEREWVAGRRVEVNKAARIALRAEAGRLSERACMHALRCDFRIPFSLLFPRKYPLVVFQPLPFLVYLRPPSPKLRASKSSPIQTHHSPYRDRDRQVPSTRALAFI